MIPDFDPNKKLEENLQKDGEFLRDVDKGHTPTETGLNLDLGIVRDEHAGVMEDLGAVADAEAPAPPDRPYPDSQYDRQQFTSMRRESDAADRHEQVVAKAQKEKAERKQRLGIEEAQTDHARTFVEMGNVVRDAQPQQEQPTPLTSSVADMDRLSFPREQHQTQVRGAMESVVQQQSEWNSTLTDLLQEMADHLRQHRLELEQIRGFMERIRL
jgi:hypothetical protein